jgi:nicotinate dehydrogenase subunit B
VNYEDETPGGTFAPLPDVNRRDFLKVFGAGITIFVTIDGLKAFQEPSRLPAGRQGYPTDFNAYLRVQTDGRVACFAGKVELGQGSMTALPQLIADELDVPLDKVDITLGDTDVCPWDMGTFGSLTIRQFGPVFRAAAAEARLVLLQLAAEKLQVPAEQLRTENGAVVAGTGAAAKRATYAELAQGRTIERHLDKRPDVKPPSALKVIGTSAKRRDIGDKVTGKAKYAGDIVLPGMLHAKIVRPPAHGAKVKSMDTAAAEKVPGAQLVRDGDLVALVHQYPDEAERARDLVKADWDVPPSTLDDVTIFDHLVKNAPQGARDLVHESGSLADGARASVSVVDSRFLNSYVAHAPMETHTATANIENGKVTVWVSTQAPFTVKTQVMQALGLPGDKVRVITPFVGGGFGGKTAGPQAVEAARLAKLTSRPVQVMWSRDEEFFYDTFRPAAVVTIKSGATDAGKISLWDFTVYAAGDRDAKQFYDVPNQRTVAHGGWQGGAPGYHPFGIGPWRAPSVNTNTFARESQIDIMAAKAALDPVEFRRRNLSDKRMLRVLAAAAERFKWTPGKAPSGRGVGVALAIYSGSYVATFAEISVDRATGRVKVKRLVCAEEIGQVVNPEGAKLQVEGSLTMGLGYALTEEIHFKGGNIADRALDSYQLPHFSWLPSIETIVIDAPELPASGGGEPPIVCMGAVLANAVFDATGARLYQLPMTPERIKAALKTS